MTKAARLLQRAYTLVDQNRIEDAALVLDAVVEEEPQNVEAWELYLQISSTRGELEWLGKRIQSKKELKAEDKKTILAYQRYLIGQLASKTKVRVAPAAQLQLMPLFAAVVVLAIIMLVRWQGPAMAKIFLGLLTIGSVLWLAWKNRPLLFSRGLSPRRFAKEVPVLELNHTDAQSKLGSDRPIITYNKPIIKVGPEKLPATKLGSNRSNSLAARKRDHRSGATARLKLRSKE